MVRVDGQALNDLGIDPPDRDRGDEPHSQGQAERPQDAGEGTADQQGRGDRRQAGQDVEREELGVEVGVADARRDPAIAVDQIELVELVAERNRHEEQARQHAEMDADARVEDSCTGHRREQIACPGHDQRRDHQAVDDRLDQPQEGEIKQEEGDVPVEDRIGHGLSGWVERHAVQPQDDRLPAGGHCSRDAERREDDDDDDHGASDRHRIR